jgi:hypothetical protein
MITAIELLDKKRKMEEKISAFESTIGQATQGSAAVIGAGGQVTDPLAGQRQQIEAEMAAFGQGLTDPTQIARMQALRTQLSYDAQRDVAAAQGAVGSQRFGSQLAIQAQAAGQANAARIAADEQFIEAAADRIALAHASGRDDDQTQTLQDIQQRFGSRSAEITHRVMNLAAGTIGKQLRTLEVARAGRTPSEFEQKVEMYELQGLPRLTAMQAASGEAFLDPASGQYITGSPTGEFAARRSMLAASRDLLPQLEVAALQVAQAGAGTPFAGTVNEWMREFGAGDPSIATYDNLVRAFVTNIVQQKSGASYTDRQMQFLLRLIPLLSELRLSPDGTLDPAAQARFDSLKSIIEVEIAAPLDPRIKFNDAQKTSHPADIRIGQMAEKFLANQITDQQFAKELSLFREKRGAYYDSRIAPREGESGFDPSGALRSLESSSPGPAGK